jgi:hypothetical protein
MRRIRPRIMKFGNWIFFFYFYLKFIFTVRKLRKKMYSKKLLVRRVVLWIHFIDIFMRIPKQFDFLFYDFL